jgi:uncharacterized protein
VDLTSRLRSIVRAPNAPPRELTYEPDTGRYEATIDIDRVADVLGGQVVENRFGRALIVERRYESDRFHGTRRVGDCDVADGELLRLLDPGLRARDGLGERTLFVDLETTGLSGGAGTVAFLVGVGWFDLGAFQVRQFLLTSYASERALLCAVAECFDAAALLITYNGKTFDVPVMETRWAFHRIDSPISALRHFDMVHVARRLWKRPVDVGQPGSLAANCQLSSLEQRLFAVARCNDVDGFDIPTVYFRFLRRPDPQMLESVLEHNRNDLLSLAVITAEALNLIQTNDVSALSAEQALGLARVYERSGEASRLQLCLDRAAEPNQPVGVQLEALYRLALLLRRQRRFDEAAGIWRRLIEHCKISRSAFSKAAEKAAVHALAVHHEHRRRELETARKYATWALVESDPKSSGAARHRLARIDRKLKRRQPTLIDGMS